MFKLNSIELNHFMCIDHAFLDFDGYDTVIFQGENGQGKSAVMEAIAISLTPNHKKSDKLSEYVQVKQKKPAEITLKADNEGFPIKFYTKINSSGTSERTIEYTKEDGTLDTVSGATETGKILQKFELDFYSDIILSMQGKNDIAELTPTQRAEMLQKLFQFDFAEKVDVWSLALKEAKDNQKVNIAKIELANQTILTKEESKKSIIDEEYPFGEREYLIKQQQEDDCFKQINEANEVLAKNTELYNKKSEEERNVSNWTNEINRINVNIEAINKSKKELELLNNSSELKDIEVEIENIKTLIDESTKEISNSNEASNKLKNNIQANAIKAASLKTELAVFKKKMDLAEKGICPECGQSTCDINKEEIASNIEALTNNIFSMEEENSKFSREDQNISLNIREKTAANIENNKKLSKLSERRVVFSSKKKELEDKTKEDVSDYLLKVKELNDKIIKSKDNIISYDKEIQENINAAGSVRSITLKYKTLQEELKKYDEIKLKNISNKEKLNTLDKEIIDLNKSISDIEKTQADLTDKVDTYSEAIKVLDKEFPSYLTIKTCNDLDVEINSFVQAIFPNVQICLKKSKKGVEFFYVKDSDKDIHELDDKELINAKMASGYEKAVFSIAFKLSLCRAYNLTFAALDEIDSAASDANSTKTFESIIDNKVFNQIFFITHSVDTVKTIREINNNVLVYHVENGVFTIDEE